MSAPQQDMSLPTNRSGQLAPAPVDAVPQAGWLSAFKHARNRIHWIWFVARSRLQWGWRLHALGHHSVLCRCMQMNNPRAVAIGDGVVILEDFVLADLRPDRGPWPKIVIGDACTILYRFQCNAAESVVIGRNVLIAGNVFISDSDHVLEPGVPITRSNKYRTRPVRIEDNCWLGQNAVILKGVIVGHDSIVGANTVVTRDVPPLSVVAGNPARVIKTLDAPPHREGAIS